MSLSFDWTRTPKADSIPSEVKYTACVATMLVGVGDLSTPKGHAEYLMRLTIFEALHGPLMRGADGELSLAEMLKDTYSVEGLRTNVALEPRGAWMKKQTDRALRELLAD